METIEADLNLKKQKQIGMDCKGDIYLYLPTNREQLFVKKMGVKGPVFRAIRRDTGFQEWERSQKDFFRLGSFIPDASYYDIESDKGQKGEDSFCTPNIIGVFVPSHIDKKSVAESLRSRFGYGAILLREDENPQSKDMPRE